jgi:hypothetical protein
MNASHYRKLIRLVSKFEKAVRADEMGGAMMPDDRREAELEYKRIKAELIDAIGEEP